MTQFFCSACWKHKDISQKSDFKKGSGYYCLSCKESRKVIKEKSHSVRNQHTKKLRNAVDDYMKKAGLTNV